MKNHKTQYMAFMAMFLAIEIALVLTPLGYIQLGIISATTMHIPVQPFAHYRHPLSLPLLLPLEE